MPSSQKPNQSSQPSMPWWQKLLPYFLYFLFPFTLTIYTEYENKNSSGGFIDFDFGYLIYLFVWGFLLVSFVFYFVLRKVFIKAPGTKYAVFVFLLNPYVALLLIYNDNPYLLPTYILFMLVYSAFLLSQKRKRT